MLSDQLFDEQNRFVFSDVQRFIDFQGVHLDFSFLSYPLLFADRSIIQFGSNGYGAHLKRSTKVNVDLSCRNKYEYQYNRIIYCVCSTVPLWIPLLISSSGFSTKAISTIISGYVGADISIYPNLKGTLF
jgi:hypothetical protein